MNPPERRLHHLRCAVNPRFIFVKSHRQRRSSVCTLSPVRIKKDWTELPDDMLAIIFEKSKYSVDYLGFRLVCSSWRRVMMDYNIRASTEHQIPMLLVPKKKGFWKVFNPVQNKFLDKLVFKIPHNISFSGSSLGWLVAVNKDFTITLHKPYFGVGVGDHQTISLPTLFPPDLDNLDELDVGERRGFMLSSQEFHVHKILITSDPVLNPKECVIVAIFGQERKLAFLRYATDTSWTMLELEQGFEIFNDLVYHRNRIYAIKYTNKVVSFDVPEVGNPVINLVTPPTKNDWVYYNSYLVKTPEGDLLQIVRQRNSSGKLCWTELFSVFILNAEDSIGSWMELESLGDMAIFVGDNTSIAVRASDFHGCYPNCIYFTHDKDCTRRIHHFQDFGIFELTKKKFYSCFNVDPYALFRMPKRPLWLLPIMI